MESFLPVALREEAKTKGNIPALPEEPMKAQMQLYWAEGRKKNAIILGRGQQKEQGSIFPAFSSLLHHFCGDHGMYYY